MSAVPQCLECPVAMGLRRNRSAATGSCLALRSRAIGPRSGRLGFPVLALILLTRFAIGRAVPDATSFTLTVTVGRPARPPFATLVRVRQEVSKRLDAARGAASTVEASELSRLLKPAVRPRASDPAFPRWLAARADTRFPRRHLIAGHRPSLPDADRLVAIAEEAAAGDWYIFGKRVTIDRPDRWTVHPLTGTPTPLRHWQTIQFMNGIDGADVKYIWELNRHRHLVRIAQGYFVTQREELAERVVALIDQWVLENPPACGINWTTAVEMGFRVIAWCWTWSLTAGSPAWTTERLSRFLVSLWHHAHHIDRYDSTHHSPNTHLTGEMLALLYVGLTFPELSRAERWAARAMSVLESELERQVLGGGMHYERSIGYHRYTAEFYLHLALLARSVGKPLSPTIEGRVRELVEISWKTRRPDGTWPIIGDEDSGSTVLLGTGDPQSHATILAVGAALFDEPKWVSGADVGGRSGAWWLLDTTALQSLGAMTPTPASASGSLGEAGYYVGRENVEPTAWYCLVDAGPHGGDQTGHAHTDVGHVEISHGSTLVVTDPGCASYTTARGQRDWYRSEGAHACVVIDGAPLAVPRGAFAWERVSAAPDVVAGDERDIWWCDLVYRRPSRGSPVTHRRQVALVRGLGVVIADWIGASEPLSFAVHWPLAPGAARLDGPSVHGDGFVGQWVVAVGEGGAPELQRICSSPAYGRELDAMLLRVPVQCDGQAVLATAFTEHGVRMKAAVGASGTVLCELNDGARWNIAIEPGKAPRVMPAAPSE